MTRYIDGALYPDCDPPTDLRDEHEAADFLMRVCGACDFGMPPSDETVVTLRTLRDTFDRFPILDSMAYHALRRWFGWPELPHVGAPWNSAAEQDAREGRPPDDTLI